MLIALIIMYDIMLITFINILKGEFHANAILKITFIPKDTNHITLHP
jgi:hypothetical protein